MHNKFKLKQARHRTGLSLTHMAYLLQTDKSNLSKYERGIWPPSRHIIFAYHIITGIPLKKLFTEKIRHTIDYVTDRITKLITELETQEVKNRKINRALASLHEVLNNISCLEDVTQKENHE